jgi:hypothetical protein
VIRGVSALIACVIATLTLGTVGGASPRPTPPREIIAKIFNPIERSELGRVKSFILTGTATLGKQHGAVTTYWKAPDKFVIVTKYTDESESYAIGFNGRKGWFAYPSGVLYNLSPKHEKSNDCSGLWLSHPEWFPDRWPTTARYVGWTMIQNEPAILVDVTLKLCGTDRYSYDARTLRPIFQNQDATGRVWLDRNAPTVRGPYGLEFQAFHRVGLSGTSVRGSIWYQSVRVNLPLDDAMFAKPLCWGQCRHG